MSLMDRLDRFLAAETDARPLVVTRLLIGLAALVRGVETARILQRVLAPGHLRLPQLASLPVLPSSGVWLLAIAWCGCALLFAAGVRPRLFAGLLLALVVYTLALDQQTYSNHLYLLAWILLLMIFALRPRQAGPRAPAWPVFLLKLQLTVVYLFAALAKLNAAFLSGGLILGSLRHAGPLAIPVAWQRAEVLVPLAVLSLVIEVFLAFAFWAPRLRRAAAVSGLAFHLAFLVLLTGDVAVQLLAFALEMLALYALFFEGNFGPALGGGAGEW